MFTFKNIRSACGICLLLLCLSSGAKWILSYSSAPPSGQTGSPGDGSNCTSCHSGSAQSNSSSLELSGLPAEGWQANTQYNLTLAFNPPSGSRFGFEMTAENSSNSKMGTWITGSGSGVISTNWIGHANASSTKQWSFSWTAPSSGQGTITFYAAANAANSNGSNTGDTIHLKSWSLSESLAPSAPSNPQGQVLSTSSIKWLWDDVANETGYRVFSSTGGQISSDLAANTTFFIQSGLLENTAYQASVKAFNNSGSSQASTATAKYTLANQPTSSAIVSISSSTTQISWAQSQATKYWVERSSISSLAGFVHIATTTQSPYEDSGLQPSTTYYWKLRGVNGDNISTSYDSVITTQTHPTLPEIPIVLGLAIGSTTLSWNWVTVSSVSSFFVITSTGGILTTLSGNTSYWIETNLQPETSYSRKIRSQNPSGFVDSPLATATTLKNVFVSTDIAISLVMPEGTSVDYHNGAFESGGALAISTNPTIAPIFTSTSDVTLANSKLTSDLTLVASSAREFAIIVGLTRSTASFSSPVTISIPYSDADSNDTIDGTSLSVDNLSIYRLNETSKEWMAVAGSLINKSLKTVSAQVTHFSVFALIGTTPTQTSSNLSSIKIFPNPFKPRTGATQIHFQNLTQEATIKIYTLSGDLLTTLAKTSADGNEKTWDVRNVSGEPVASGVYLALIESPNGEKKILKLAVER